MEIIVNMGECEKFFTAFCAAGIFAPTAAKSTAEAVIRAAIVSGKKDDQDQVIRAVNVSVKKRKVHFPRYRMVLWQAKTSWK